MHTDFVRDRDPCLAYALELAADRVVVATSRKK